MEFSLCRVMSGTDLDGIARNEKREPFGMASYMKRTKTGQKKELFAVALAVYSYYNEFKYTKDRNVLFGFEARLKLMQNAGCWG